MIIVSVSQTARDDPLPLVFFRDMLYHRPYSNCTVKRRFGKMARSDKLLTIGQFAALHGINKKTLMWYDEIGLFRPAVIHPENGYRYYSYHQSSILETILLLREQNVSIDEIQSFMDTGQPPVWSGF